MAHSNYSQSAVEQIKRHPKYYLNGGDVHFLVENYIYRVHRYFFERESAWFREKLGAPAPAGQTPKGSSDANPFPLEEVAADDFSKFLWVFYNPKYSIYDAVLEDWVAILKLAFDWRFSEVKKLCSRELEKYEIAPVPKIELYQTYELDKKLLIPSYMAICLRAEPLSIKEGRHLGLETALLLATARECARGKPLANGARSPTAAELEEEDMVSIIKEIFGLTAGPPSPSLTPLDKGTGVATFTGIAPTPTTSPRKGIGASLGSVTRELGGGSGKPVPVPPESPTKPSAAARTTNTTSMAESVPTIAKPAAPHPSLTASASAARSKSPPPTPSPFSGLGSGFGAFSSLVGNVAGELLGTSSSPTLAPSSPSQPAANSPAGTNAPVSNTTTTTPAAGKPTTTTSSTATPPTGQASSSASDFQTRLTAVCQTQGTSLAPLQTQDLPPPGKTPKTGTRTPQPWPKPPATRNLPPPQSPAIPKTPSPPSRVETERAPPTTVQIPATKGSTRQGKGAKTKSKLTSGRDAAVIHEAGQADGSGMSLDDTNTVYDPMDSTEPTNTIGGAGTDVVVTTNSGPKAIGESAEVAKDADAALASNPLAGGEDEQVAEPGEGGEGEQQGKHDPEPGSSEAAITPSPQDATSANSQEAASEDLNAGDPTSGTSQRDVADPPLTNPPGPVAEGAATDVTPLDPGAQDNTGKVNAAGEAAAAGDPASTSGAEDAAVEDGAAVEDKVTPTPVLDAPTPAQPLKGEGPSSADKALPPPPGEKDTAGAAGESSETAAGTTIAQSSENVDADDNAWGFGL
ncbi:hypothetical protein TRAPUB_9655 [Trametes pubescens]|uniref:BTB domain-containing protein n=1 Tax=Trametes pubescens TaxID=154538 RepID=A0A1M2W1T2_TRAPU|nr:hypothetical protein TRAPUB_9655 [Trametes pubescens]